MRAEAQRRPRLHTGHGAAGLPAPFPRPGNGKFSGGAARRSNPQAGGCAGAGGCGTPRMDTTEGAAVPARGCPGAGRSHPRKLTVR